MRLFRILDRESDREHRFTLHQLLEKMGLDPSPSSNDGRNLRNDIDSLRDAGYDVVCERHKAPEYYLGARRFTADELKALVDIVQSSVSITQEMSDNLVESILSLGSAPEAKALRKGIRVGNRVKMQNPELFESIHEIQEARASSPRRKISFRYFNYDFDFNRKYHTTKDGCEIITETPLLLTYSDGFFYIVTYSDEKERTVTRRIDRMEGVTVTAEKGTWREDLQGYDIDDRMVFGMFIDDEPRWVNLIVKEDAMNPLIDRFGKDMKVKERLNEGKARVAVKVFPSKQFEGWVYGLGDLAEIESKPTYPVVTLCGSTRFKDEFLAVQKKLTLEGWIVLTVGLFGHSGDDEVWEGDTKEMLDDMHKRKIDMSEAIYVVNPGGYIGESTRNEIEYAKEHDKTIMFLEEYDREK